MNNTLSKQFKNYCKINNCEETNFELLYYLYLCVGDKYIHLVDNKITLKNFKNNLHN